MNIMTTVLIGDIVTSYYSTNLQYNVLAYSAGDWWNTTIVVLYMLRFNTLF